MEREDVCGGRETAGAPTFILAISFILIKQASDLNKVENSRLYLLLQIVCLQDFYVSMLHYVLYLVVEKLFSLLILKFYGRSNQVDFSSDEFFLRN